MTANELEIADGRYAEKIRRAAELQAQWDSEDSNVVIDLREHADAKTAC